MHRITQLCFALLVVTLHVSAVPLAPGLADPSVQPIFVEIAPNALDPDYIYSPKDGADNYYAVDMGKSSEHESGLLKDGEKVKTTIFGYGQDGEYLWPGKTFLIQSTRAGGGPITYVEWNNKLKNDHIFPVDTNLHWCYSLPGYTDYSIKNNGIPVVPHLHGGRSDSQFDGNPEFFFSPDNEIVGPQWVCCSIV
jgi:hypothetical protein